MSLHFHGNPIVVALVLLLGLLMMQEEGSRFLGLYCLIFGSLYGASCITSSDLGKTMTMPFFLRGGVYSLVDRGDYYVRYWRWGPLPVTVTLLQVAMVAILAPFLIVWNFYRNRYAWDVIRRWLGRAAPSSR